MANDIDISSLNPIKNVDFSSLGHVFAIIFISFLILGMIGFLVFLQINKKKWWIRVPLYKKIGNVPTRLGVLKGKVVPMGRAGDYLWFVKGAGIKKWLPPAEMQSAKNEYPHYIREDGEWVNFVMSDIDAIQKQANVKYVKTDMRLQRLATDKLLEQRHLKRSFLEKWGAVIGFAIFFLVIAVSLVVFFSQFSKVIDQVSTIMDKADTILEKAAKIESNSGTAELVPAFIPLLWFSVKQKKRQWREKWKSIN